MYKTFLSLFMPRGKDKDKDGGAQAVLQYL